MDSAFIHQAANELVQNAGTRNMTSVLIAFETL